jgi:hypothetical protein
MLTSRTQFVRNCIVVETARMHGARHSADRVSRARGYPATRSGPSTGVGTVIRIKAPTSDVPMRLILEYHRQDVARAHTSPKPAVVVF